MNTPEENHMAAVTPHLDAFVELEGGELPPRLLALII
jgi:hypothetical protein